MPDLPLDPIFLQNMRYEAGLDKDEVKMKTIGTYLNQIFEN